MLKKLIQNFPVKHQHVRVNKELLYLQNYRINILPNVQYTSFNFHALPNRLFSVMNRNIKDELPKMTTNSFEALCSNSNTIVDKSLFIKQILDDNAKIMSFTYPRRWGKSTNLTMLKGFFEHELDKNGKEIEPMNVKIKYYFKGEV